MFPACWSRSSLVRNVSRRIHEAVGPQICNYARRSALHDIYWSHDHGDDVLFAVVPTDIVQTCAAAMTCWRCQVSEKVEERASDLGCRCEPFEQDPRCIAWHQSVERFYHLTTQIHVFSFAIYPVLNNSSQLSRESIANSEYTSR